MRGHTNNRNNASNTIALPRSGNHQNMEEVAGAQDTIYLCNFRVSVDGEWLCLKELEDLDIQDGQTGQNDDQSGIVTNCGIANNKVDDKLDRDWVQYCRWLFSKFRNNAFASKIFVLLDLIKFP